MSAQPEPGGRRTPEHVVPFSKSWNTSKLLDANTVAAIGNGRNDRKMLNAAALGIALIQGEGAAAESTDSADIVALDILDALELFQRPARLVAPLRS